MLFQVSGGGMIMVNAILLFLLFAPWALAGGFDKYYGRDILSSNIRDASLRENLHSVLAKPHLVQPGSDDRIVENCANNSCFQHQSIGYDNARRAVMGEFFLVSEGQRYGLVDLYCETVLWQEEFAGAKPAPQKVPDPKIANTEHSWPQSKFNKYFPQDLQKSDLHHLFSVSSVVNSARSSLSFGDVRVATQPLKCESSKLGLSDRGGETVFEPPSSHKGNVARALFYFSVRYKTPIDLAEEETLREWHRLDPVDDGEAKRNQRIFELQKNRNPFVDFPELVERIRDF
jgi:deoxyribonuclease I